MKNLFVMALALCGILFLAGCGNGVDENKTPAEIKQEVANMSQEDIQKTIEAYKEVIAEKTEALTEELAKLKDIPLTEMLGDEAKKIKDNVGSIEDSIAKLTKNMQAYAEGIVSK